MKRKVIVAAIILMAVGFAAVSTTLYLNGNVSVTSNLEDYDVYYSNAKVNGVEDKTVITDDTHIVFTKEFKSVGDTFTLEYYITNGSRNYDSDVTMSCTSGNDYVTVTNNWVNHTVIESTTTKDGLLTLEMIKGYTGNDPLELKVECEITASAAERDSLGTGTPADKVEQGVNLYNLMKASAKSDTIDFKFNSGTSGTNGIYTTTETEGSVPVYYYRGSANQVNNNIIYNNMCWKIIRTTETGGVKLIYNGTPTDGKCEIQTGTSTQIGTSAFNTNRNDNAYVGYMYGTAGSNNYTATHANTNESTIKSQSIDPWFEAHFDAEAVSKLEDTVFCNDRSTKAYDANTIGHTDYSSYGALGYGKNTTLYGAAHRAWCWSKNPNPTLVCTNANDKFTVSSTNGNGKLTYPVGLITLDEVILAGYNTYSSNSSNYEDTTNYLTTGQNYWTFSPLFMYAGGYVFVGNVDSTGSIGNRAVENALGVRPVVSLISGTLVETNGDGTSTNPYVVK